MAAETLFRRAVRLRSSDDSRQTIEVFTRGCAASYDDLSRCGDRAMSVGSCGVRVAGPPEPVNPDLNRPITAPGRLSLEEAGSVPRVLPVVAETEADLARGAYEV